MHLCMHICVCVCLCVHSSLKMLYQYKLFIVKPILILSTHIYWTHSMGWPKLLLKIQREKAVLTFKNCTEPIGHPPAALHPGLREPCESFRTESEEKRPSRKLFAGMTLEWSSEQWGRIYPALEKKEKMNNWGRGMVWRHEQLWGRKRCWEPPAETRRCSTAAAAPDWFPCSPSASKPGGRCEIHTVACLLRKTRVEMDPIELATEVAYTSALEKSPQVIVVGSTLGATGLSLRVWPLH